MRQTGFPCMITQVYWVQKGHICTDPMHIIIWCMSYGWRQQWHKVMQGCFKLKPHVLSHNVRFMVCWLVKLLKGWQVSGIISQHVSPTGQPCVQQTKDDIFKTNEKVWVRGKSTAKRKEKKASIETAWEETQNARVILNKMPDITTWLRSWKQPGIRSAAV